jgi:hypothetical protein
MTYKISTEQVRSTGNIADIATVERLDRIVELLEKLIELSFGPDDEQRAALDA